MRVRKRIEDDTVRVSVERRRNRGAFPSSIVYIRY